MGTCISILIYHTIKEAPPFNSEFRSIANTEETRLLSKNKLIIAKTKCTRDKNGEVKCWFKDIKLDVCVGKSKIKISPTILQKLDKYSVFTKQSERQHIPHH